MLERIEWIAPDANCSVHQLDTIFTSVRTRPRYRATRRAFERFLAARRLLTVEPDIDRFAPLLKVYRHHLIEVRGLAPATVSQHISTIVQATGAAVINVFQASVMTQSGRFQAAAYPMQFLNDCNKESAFERASTTGIREGVSVLKRLEVQG